MIVEDLPQIVAVRLHAIEARILQRVSERVARRVARWRPRNHLGEHRVEVGRYFAAGLDPRIDAQRTSVGARKRDIGQQARARLEIAARVLGIEPCLNRVPLRLQTRGEFLQRREGARRQFDHPAHQIHTPDLLGHAVFDLQTGVHLKEIELLRSAVVDEFDRAGGAVTDRFRELDSSFAQGGRHAVRQIGRGRFFEYLLVAPLHRTVAHAERDRVAAAVAEYLHFQMPRPLDVLFEEHARIAEVVLAKTLDHLEMSTQFFDVPAYPHADAAAARRAFQHHGVADRLSGCQRGGEVVQQARAIEHRHTLVRCDPAGRVLQAKRPQLRWRRSDELDARCLARFAKGRILGQESIARMNCLDVFAAGDLEDLAGVEVGGGSRTVTETVRDGRLAHMEARAIRFRVDGDAGYIEFTQRSEDAARNGTTIGDQDFLEHERGLDSWAGRPATWGLHAAVVRGRGPCQRCAWVSCSRVRMQCRPARTSMTK